MLGVKPMRNYATNTDNPFNTKLIQSKFFTLNGLFKICIIFMVGYITRWLINDIYDVNVFKDYTGCLSVSYYLFMASVSVFINENFTTVSFKGINFNTIKDLFNWIKNAHKLPTASMSSDDNGCKNKDLRKFSTGQMNSSKSNSAGNGSIGNTAGNSDPNNGGLADHIVERDSDIDTIPATIPDTYRNQPPGPGENDSLRQQWFNWWIRPRVWADCPEEIKRWREESCGRAMGRPRADFFGRGHTSPFAPTEIRRDLVVGSTFSRYSEARVTPVGELLFFLYPYGHDFGQPLIPAIVTVGENTKSYFGMNGDLFLKEQDPSNPNIARITIIPYPLSMSRQYAGLRPR